MAKTIEQGFDTFLGWLKPLNSEHEKAQSHKASVESCLINNFRCYNFFETGSFGKGTGIRHYSDTDYFGVFPAAEVWNDSSYTLRKIKEALQLTFWKTYGIEVKSPSVKIPFGSYASETLEVTPATRSVLVSTPMGDKYSYDIPNNEGGWMKSSPSAHIAYINRENSRLGGKLKALIQLIKAWKYYNSVPISSFYLELRIAKYAEGESSIIYDIDIQRVLKTLYENDLPSIQDPMGISGYVKACSTAAKRDNALSKLKTGYTRADIAVGKRESNADDAFYWWNLFYNDNFPKR